MIFRDNAQAHWDKGLNVMPLIPRGKRPTEPAWSSFATQPIPDSFKARWLENNADGNIGVVCGPESNIVFIDVDTDDQTLKNVIEEILPVSPYVRYGRKGYAAAYRYSGEETFRIKSSSGEMLVECLSSGTQTVLPPSIHPDTRKPYSANTYLPAVVDELPRLPPKLESLLRSNIETLTKYELSSSGWTRVTEFVSSGSRDNQMTRVAGHFAYGVTRGELTFKEAVARMRAWYETCSEKVAGDTISIDKGINNLVKFLLEDVLGPKNKPLPIGWDEGLDDAEKEQLGLDFGTDVEEWDYDKAVLYFRNVVKNTDASSPERMQAVNHVLRKLSRSPTLSELEAERVLKYINNVMKDLSLPSLKKHLKSLQAGDLSGNDHSEIARAVIEDLERNGSIRYHNTEFWQWQGSHWEPMKEVEILRHISEEYGSLPAAKKQGDHKGIMQVMGSLVPQGIKDIDVKGINFANGFLKMDQFTQEVKMVPHEEKYGVTYTLPFRYDREKRNSCPQFLNFLKSVWGKDVDYHEKVNMLRQLMAITVFGVGPSFERAVLLYGLPSSGKTQLLRIVQSLMPEGTVSFIPPYQFSDKFAATELSKSLLNVCGELSNEKNINGETFKSIVDGSEMSGQYKRKQLFNFVPKCTHWFASNHLPKSRDVSEGFTRRWAILTFNGQVDKDAQIRDLGLLLVSEEREEIMAWAVESMYDLVKKPDVDLPPSHVQTMKDLSAGNDTVFFWMLAGDVETATSDLSTELKSLYAVISSNQLPPQLIGLQTPVQDLYEDYYNFCTDRATVKPVGLRSFCMRMRELAAIKGFRMILPENGDITQAGFIGVTVAVNPAGIV